MKVKNKIETNSCGYALRSNERRFPLPLLLPPPSAKGT
jgi:hypothetical protein